MPRCASTVSILAHLVLVAGLAGCAGFAPAPADVGTSPWAVQDASPGPAATQKWEHHRFPGKTPSRYGYIRKDGRDALAVRASSSASMVRARVQVKPEEIGDVRFSWQVPSLIATADMAQRDADDSPVRVVLAFDGDRSRLAQRDVMLSELAKALTGEEMPYATLMYVWSNDRPVGDVIFGPRTSRIRKVVVESGPLRLNQWLEYRRDIRADFERAFGEAPGMLIGIGVMTDTDNTRSQARAWYGPVRLVPTRVTAP